MVDWPAKRWFDAWKVINVGQPDIGWFFHFIFLDHVVMRTFMVCLWDFIQPKNCEISNSRENIFCKTPVVGNIKRYILVVRYLHHSFLKINYIYKLGQYHSHHCEYKHRKLNSHFAKSVSRNLIGM